MRESCSCGDAIHTLFYRRALTWRATHVHAGEHTLLDIDSQTSFPTGFMPAEEDDEE